MSVTIRLSKLGKRNAPSYKVVVSNTRDKREGRYLDILGYYNPSKTPAELEIDKDKVNEWKNKGALVTGAVEKLLDGKYEYVKYDPKGKDKKDESKADEVTTETEVQEESAENKEAVEETN
jgi:small subunit ribosomal protein S16